MYTNTSNIQKTKSGFTLIELLVVIAIIGLLASVILASLNSARTKGADSAVKSNLNNMRSQAALYYDSNANSYGTFPVNTCPVPTAPVLGTMFSDATILQAIAAALANGGNGTRCVSATGSYAIAVGLKTANQSWCIDSTGNSKQFAGTPTAAITAGLCT